MRNPSGCNSIWNNPKKQSMPHNKSGVNCPDCGGTLVLKHGKFGKFYGCTKFPECTGTRSIGSTSNKFDKKIKAFKIKYRDKDMIA